MASPTMSNNQGPGKIVPSSLRSPQSGQAKMEGPATTVFSGTITF
jgi:hypothetical protein